MESLQVAPEREIHEAVKVEPRMEWRPQKLGGAGNTDCVLRKTAGCGENLMHYNLQGQRDWALPKPFGENIL